MTFQTIQLIAGLANPGKEYAKSRHNAGAWFVEALAKHGALMLKPEVKFHGAIAKFAFGSDKGWLLIPSTYMNNSGRSIRALADFYHIAPESILVIHDDLDLPVGTARFKQGGGEGGHNGLKDIVAQLGSKDFWRLRLGIGHPAYRDRVHDYVLSAPSITDRKKIEEASDKALAILPRFIAGEKQQAIQTLHNKEEK